MNDNEKKGVKGEYLKGICPFCKKAIQAKCPFCGECNIAINMDRSVLVKIIDFKDEMARRAKKK
jgi:hypothetical protein